MPEIPLTLVVGNGNCGYAVELCIRSFMRHNAEYTSEIIIADNSSNDYSLEFYKKNPYKDITQIRSYMLLRDRDLRQDVSIHEHIHVGLAACKTEWALLTHADVEWKAPVVPRFYEILKANPDLFMSGLGGGNPITGGCKTRFHEWLLFIHIPKFKEYQYSFEARFGPGGYYDVTSFMYRQAWMDRRVLVPFDTYESEGPHLKHYVAVSRSRKGACNDIARGILEKEYWNAD